ncbi:MAG: hypothetical protein WCX21_08575, partial [Bacteroidales bacterium]
KQVYCTGEYIWFNAYLTNNSCFSLLPESNYIYAELIHKDTVLSRVKIKRCVEGFPGRIPLQTDLPSGKYILRAYTDWMQNFPEIYMFHKEITLINPLDAKSDSFTVQAFKNDSLFGIQFLPESGRYIPGDLAVFAFKAVTTDGRGIGVTGAVFNSRDSIITSFSDTYKGMGKLIFHPAPNERYYAVIRSKQGTELKQSLPALSETGAVIHVTKRGDKRFIRTVVTGSLLEKPLFIVLSNGSEVFLCNRIAQQEYEIAMKEAWLLNGINHATIVDEEGRVFAQRIFFVYPPDLIRADIFADKPEPDKREKITYTIRLLDTLETGVEGTFSLSVTDRYLTPHTASDHLLSYMLLSSELSGAVEDPAALFDFSREDRSEAMDLVMMIHGWRYYDIPAIIKNTIPNSLPEKEYSQTISGKVSSFYNRVSKSEIIIYSPAINLSYYEPMDRSGKFEIRNLDFPDSTQFVLSCTGKRGSTAYYLEIDLPFFPAVEAARFLSNTTALSGQHFKEILNEYTLSDKDEKDETSTLLEEVVVTASQHFVNPEINPSPFNQSFETRQIRERKQLEKFDGMLLMDYLISSFGSISNGGVDEHGRRWLRSTAGFSTSGANEPKVYIDHMKMENTSDLDRLYVGEIENVAVLRSAEAGALYNSPGGVILISMRKSFSQVAESINTKIITPLGWQKPSRFYSPDYSLKQDREAVTYDNRTTLYWNPFIRTDENGVAEISFYTSDRKTAYRFSIEGITSDGDYIAILKNL